MVALHPSRPNTGRGAGDVRNMNYLLQRVRDGAYVGAAHGAPYTADVRQARYFATLRAAEDECGPGEHVIPSTNDAR